MWGNRSAIYTASAASFGVDGDPSFLFLFFPLFPFFLGGVMFFSLPPPPFFFRPSNGRGFRLALRTFRLLP